MTNGGSLNNEEAFHRQKNAIAAVRTYGMSWRVAMARYTCLSPGSNEMNNVIQIMTLTASEDVRGSERRYP